MKLNVETIADSAHTLAVEWTWRDADGCMIVGPKPPTLVITVTQLDSCDRKTSRSRAITEADG